MQTLKRNKKKIDKEVVITAIILILPTFLLTFFFKYVMTGESIIYSFFSYDRINPPGKFVGLKNFITILSSYSIFWPELKNTLILWGLGVLFGFFTPIIQALLLNEIKGKTRSLFKYLYVLPAAIPGVAGLTVWRYIWNADSGLANMIIGIFGISPQTWLMDEKLIKWCLCIPGILGGGLNMLIYLITIEGISPEIYEAAEIDGANRFQIMNKITIPNIVYMIKIQFLLNISGSLLAFDNVYIMTDGAGGPNNAAKTVVFGIYDKAYSGVNGQYGQAMAISVILVILTLLILLINKLIQKCFSRGKE